MSIQPSEFAKLAVVIGMALLVAERTEGRWQRRVGLGRRRRHAGDRRRPRGADPAAARPRHHARAVGDRLRRARGVRGAAAVAGGLLAAAWAPPAAAVARAACSRSTSSTGSWRSPTPTSTRAVPATTPSRRASRSATAGSSARGSSTARRPRAGFVPEQHTDFIFTVAGEELGLVGAGLLIALLGVVIWRALAIACPHRRRLRPPGRGGHRLLVRLPGVPEHRDVPRHHAGDRRTPARSCRTAAARCSPACSPSGCCRTSTCAPPPRSRRGSSYQRRCSPAEPRSAGPTPPARTGRPVGTRGRRRSR